MCNKHNLVYKAISGKIILYTQNIFTGGVNLQLSKPYKHSNRDDYAKTKQMYL